MLVLLDELINLVWEVSVVPQGLPDLMRIKRRSAYPLSGGMLLVFPVREVLDDLPHVRTIGQGGSSTGRSRSEDYSGMRFHAQAFVDESLCQLRASHTLATALLIELTK